MKTSIFANNIFFIVILVVFLFFSLSFNYYFILFFIYFLFIVFKFKRHKVFIVSNIIIVLLIFIIYCFFESKYDTLFEEQEVYFYSQITDKDDKLYVKYKSYTLYVYYDQYDEFEIGDYVYIIGNFNKIEDKRIFNAFDYKDYLKYNKIKGICYASNIQFISKKFHVNSLKSFVYKYIDKYIKDYESNMIIKGLVLGDSSLFSEELNEDIRINGIVHLFAVSGLHVNLFISLFIYFFKYFKVKEKFIDIIIICFLMVYIVITSFSPSILRSSLMFFIAYINKTFFKSVFSSLDVCSFSFILLLIINPYFVYNLGFVLSYFVCFVLILSSSIIRNKSNMMQSLIMSFMSNVFTLPLIINYNYEINLLSPIVNVVFIFLVSSIILPLTVFILICPFFVFIYNYIIEAFLYFISLCSNFEVCLKLPRFNSFLIFVYYLIILCFFVCFRNKYYRYLFCFLYLCFVFMFSNKQYFYSKNNIECFYLNDGEALLFRNHHFTILVDTGDAYNNELLLYLKSEGIKKIDYLIISHNHNDHNGALFSICEEIDVRNVLVSDIYSANLDGIDNVYRCSVGDSFVCNEMSFTILFPYEVNEDENDNSMVVYFCFKDYKFLLMGDLTCKYESYIIDYLKKHDLEVDILKIGHHGSDTSTSRELIEYLRPKYALILTGRKWIDIFPKKCIIDLLSEYNITVLQTKALYSFKMFFSDANIYISSVH